MESPLHLTVLSVWMDDVGMLADLETSESDAENGDTWVCAAAKCRTTNKARKSRCDHCWRVRTGSACRREGEGAVWGRTELRGGNMV